MSNSTSRQTLLDAYKASWYAENMKELPSAQPERIIYANMSDEEFEKWLYEHGICNPNIHEPIPCDVVPLLIDNAISELPPVQPKRETATVSVGISKGGVTMWYECEACGEPVDQGDTFCSGCGRKLIHE